MWCFVVLCCLVSTKYKKNCFLWGIKQSHEIQNLETFTQYLVSIQVFNPEGLGPATTVLCMTDEGGKITQIINETIKICKKYTHKPYRFDKIITQLATT